MAIDKNSKAYQNLLKSWYTDEQITQMHGAVAWWQSTQDVIANTPAQNPSQRTTTQPTYQNQWAGNYVYNEKTGYYENQTDTTKNTTNQWIAPKPEQAKPITQTQGTTVSENKQSDGMKPLSDEYYQQTNDDALNKIRYNLNDYRQSNPEYFSDYETFKKNFSYDKRVTEQQNVLDEWYKWYTKGLEYASTPTNDLYTQYMNGQISTTDLENLRIANPDKYNQLQAQINKWNIISAYDDNKNTSPTNIQEIGYNMAAEAFRTMESGDYWTSQFFDEFKANMDSPEMMELSDKLTDIDEQRQNIADQISSMTKDIEKEYEWTWATKSKINAIVSDRTYELQQQLRTLDHEYTKYATQYNNRATQYQNEFQLQLQEYQINMQARNQQMNELWFALDLMNFETNEQRQQREWDYWVKQQEYTNWNINSSDYATRHKAALKSVENLLAQYPGIPTQRSAEQMADDILKAIDNGSNLWAELTKINKFMQEKPEYKKLYNNTYWEEGLTESFTVWDTQYVKYNGEWMTSGDFNKKYWNSTGKANYNIVSDSVFTKNADGGEGTYGNFMGQSSNVDWAYWWQCGRYVNNYLEEIWAWRIFGNEDIRTREWWINSEKWKVGTIAVFDYGKTSSDWINHGHVAIVVSQPDSNGNFWVKESNFKWDEKITTRMVNMKDASLKWFIDPSLGSDWKKPTLQTTTTSTTSSNWTTTTTDISMVDPKKKTYVESEIGMYDKYINEWTAPTDAKLKSIWDWDLDLWWQIWNARVQDYMDKTGAWTLENKRNTEVNKLRVEMHREEAYENYRAMQTYYEKIKNATNNDRATAASDVSLLFSYMKMLDPKSIVRESEFSTAQNMGSLPTKWHAVLKSAVNGEKLTNEQRNEIMKETKSLMDSATYLYNNLLDDYSSLITLWWDASRLWKKGIYITEDYQRQYWNTITSSSWDKDIPKTSTSPWTYQTDSWYSIADDWANFS